MWEHIDSSGGENACWPCDYGLASGGFPVISIKLAYRSYKQCKVHRLVYELVHGKIPKKGLILHTCQNLKCCNPKHLVLVNRTAALGAAAARKGQEWLDAWYMACSPTPSVEGQPAAH